MKYKKYVLMNYISKIIYLLLILYKYYIYKSHQIFMNEIECIYFNAVFYYVWIDYKVIIYNKLLLNNYSLMIAVNFYYFILIYSST